MNKPELISFSDPLMIDLNFDQKMFFRPEIEFSKGGMEGLLLSGLLKEDTNPLIEIFGSTAVLTIEGPLRPGKDWYYSTGYGDIQDAIVELIGDSRIRTVILKVDSPGGTVKQAFETHEMLQELSKEKTLIALITGSATSAAALMTFPAKQRLLASKTAQTGSIGVVSQHIDNRLWYQEFMGEIRTSVAKGELKDAGTDVRPYDEKAKLVFEGAVNKLYDIFATETVNGLGISRDIIDSYQSQVFIGSDGIDAGFADGFSSLDELIEQSKSSTLFSTPGRPAFSNHSTETNRMDINEVKAEHPDVYQAILDRGKTQGSEALKETHQAEGKAIGMVAERKRSAEVKALALPGQEKLCQELIEDGSTPAEAAVKFLGAQKETLAKVKTGIEGDLSDPLESDTPAEPTEPKGEVKNTVADYEAAVVVAQQGGKVSKGEAMKFVKLNQPDLHTAFIAHSNGQGE